MEFVSTNGIAKNTSRNTVRSMVVNGSGSSYGSRPPRGFSISTRAVRRNRKSSDLRVQILCSRMSKSWALAWYMSTTGGVFTTSAGLPGSLAVSLTSPVITRRLWRARSSSASSFSFVCSRCTWTRLSLTASFFFSSQWLRHSLPFLSARASTDSISSVSSAAEGAARKSSGVTTSHGL